MNAPSPETIGGIVYAESMSSTLLPLLQATNLSVTCLSRHDHACNFQTATGVIIALVTSQYGNGPFHIVLPHPLPSLLTSSNDLCAQWRQGTLYIGPLQVAVQQAAVWSPDLPALHPISPDALLWLHEPTTQYSPSPLHIGVGALGERAQQGVAAIQIGFTQGDFDQVRTGVTRLAGLGPGLTPAGDDFLVGLLAAFHACRLRLQEDQPNVCRLIAQIAAAQTTQLSAQWLRCAGQGHFGEAWHTLMNALNRNDRLTITTAAHRILTTGATSGVDAMNGFLFGISLLQDRRQEDTRHETEKN